LKLVEIILIAVTHSSYAVVMYAMVVFPGSAAPFVLCPCLHASSAQKREGTFVCLPLEILCRT